MVSARRLKKIEKSIRIDDFSGRQYVGRFYDELTSEERYLWLKYHDSLIAPNREPDIEAFECLQGYFPQGLHFICEDRKKPPTEAELRASIQEVEDYITERKRTDIRFKEENK